MKPLRLAALAAALFLGACSSPTDSVRLDAGASFDGGGMIGSGNFTSETQDGGNTLGSGNGVGTGSGGGGTTTSDTGGTTTSTDSTTQRGPGMMGSGN
jgi:hypothetical protein